MNYNDIVEILGNESQNLLSHKCHTIPADKITTPSPYIVDHVFAHSDRNSQVLNNLHRLYYSGRLSGTGYVSILPVDQGIEHTAAFSFYKNPDYFDPDNIVKLAIEGGCNGVVSTLGVLGLTSRRFAHKIPYIVKLNHNELLTYPEKHDQIMFSSVNQAWNLGAAGVGATIYFGSKNSNRQILEVREAFAKAHKLGMFTILWCYLRNKAFKTNHHDYHLSGDLTGQANHLGVTIEADIIKQKLPENNGGFAALKFGKYSEEIYTKLGSNHPIDLVRFQVANCYLGKIGLINSGGGQTDNDLLSAIKTAVINKRGGGQGLILGRKAFKKPLKDGIKILNALQDVYLNKEITIA
jgi:fructose-bisphosphate aldolase, class I